MRAREEVEKLLVPVVSHSFAGHEINADSIIPTGGQADGEDDLKKRQLMELAIINGTYRDSGSKQQQSQLIPYPNP